MKNKILYLCANDGSDTRVSKEIETLSKSFDIFYLGVGKKSDLSFSLEQTHTNKLIAGSHKSLKTILILIINVIKLLSKNKFEKIHVVDEQFYIFFLPFLLGQKVVLDIFDSFFLKLNLPNNKFYVGKKIIYGFPKKIIVTDENRFGLLPKFAQKKSVVIPNVPKYQKYVKVTDDNRKLTICYFGSLHKDRGTFFLDELLSYSEGVRVIAAGWLMDDYTKKFIKNDKVEYLGVMRQQQVNEILTNNGDYLLALYPVNNINNIYASPNKIYDGIQTQTPVIVNSEIIVSSFVKDNNFGFVIENMNDVNFKELIYELKKLKDTYNFDPETIKKYSWEMYEEKLLQL